jgi:hypothetical protein
VFVLNVSGGQNLVAYWSFDSTSQNTYFDMTGNGYNVLSPGQTLVPGVKGSALECIGQSFKPVVQNSVGAFNFPQFTIEGWIYSYIDMVNPGSFYNIKELFNYLSISSGLNKGFALQIRDNGKLRLCVGTSGAGGPWVGIESDSIIRPHVWYHVVGTYDGQRLTVFINGRNAGSLNYSGGYDYPTFPALIGLEWLAEGVPRDWFQGKIDELKFYNYALDSGTIASHYSQDVPPFQKPFKINVGMKQAFAHPGDTVNIPLYLTNFEQFQISACQFTLRFNSSLIKLVGVTNDSGIAKNWALLANTNNIDSVPVALGGSTTTLAYGEGELMCFKFVVSKTALQGDTATIALQNISIDENNLLTPSSVSGRIIIATPSIMYGDVTGNGEASALDAARVLEYSVGKTVLPDCPNFKPAVADVSGNGTVSSYDAALIFQYSVGLLPSFPVQIPRSLAKSAASQEANSIAEISLTAPKNVSENIYQYTLHGKNVRGFVAGQFTLQCDPAIIVTVKDVTPIIRNANLRAQFDGQPQFYNTALTTNDIIDSAEADLFSVTVQQKTGISLPGLTIKSALVNEGLIQTTIKSGSVFIMKPSVNENDVFKPISFTSKGLSIVNPGRVPVTVRAFDILGRVAFYHQFPGSQNLIFLNNSVVAKGMYLWKITLGEKTLNFKVPIAGR